MDDKTALAVLAHLTAQTQLLGVIAGYYASLPKEREFVRAIPIRTLSELHEAAPEAAELAERIGAQSCDTPSLNGA